MCTHNSIMASAGRGFYAGTRSFTWLADIVRLPIDQVNFLVCQFTALALSVTYRKLLHPQYVSAEIRHVVALAAGIGLGYFCFGYQISHLIVQATLSYIIMNTVSPHIMHRVVLFVSLLYLSSMHILRLTYDYGGWTLDITGPMMITTQKVTSIVFSLHDGLLRDGEKLTPEQRRHAIRRNPTMLEFFSYIFHFQSLMCGPLVFYNDYVDFVEGKNFIKHLTPNGFVHDNEKKTLNIYQPSPDMVVVSKLAVSIACALFLVLVVPYFPITYLTEDKFLYHIPWHSQFAYLIIATSVVRSKYYHAWLLGEAVCNASGLGFNGYSSDGKPKWDLMSNVDIIRFELSLNFRETLETWNKSTQVWLRMIAYDRAVSNKTLWTYVLSAVWHGFYPGYYFTFLGGAIFTLAARSVRRCVRPLFQGSLQMAKFYDIITCLTTRIALAYIVFPFILLECNASLKVYWRFYFIGHILALAAIMILPLILPPQRSTVQNSVTKRNQRSSMTPVAFSHGNSSIQNDYKQA